MSPDLLLPMVEAVPFLRRAKVFGVRVVGLVGGADAASTGTNTTLDQPMELPTTSTGSSALVPGESEASTATNLATTTTSQEGPP
jgi:hypothetical protein